MIVATRNLLRNFPILISRQDRGGDEPYWAIFRPRLPTDVIRWPRVSLKAIEDKSAQLHPYRADSAATVLLINFHDLSLLNHDGVAEAFRKPLKA